MISMIVAADSNNGIGYNNELLCKLKDDMRHFVRTTKNKTILMGHKTFVSLGEKPLKDRVNFVCTTNPSYCNLHYGELLSKEPYLCFDVPYMFDRMMKENPNEEYVVIGGAQIYEMYLPKVTRIYFTQIHHAFEKVDAFFPELDPKEWMIVAREDYEKNKDNEYSFSIFTLERV